MVQAGRGLGVSGVCAAGVPSQAGQRTPPQHATYKRLICPPHADWQERDRPIYRYGSPAGYGAPGGMDATKDP